ncbi:MAG TPA: hypothetical protein VE079_12200 [Ensifer sp.]|nr:hypothetical protein [Ensifer sp.]
MLQSTDLAENLYFDDAVSEAELAGSTMCVCAMKVLRYAQANSGIVLTKSGNFYRKFVEWAAEDFQWPGFEPEELYAVNKVLNETDFPPLFTLHELLLKARLLRHYKGRALLTRSGAAVLGRHAQLQIMLATHLLQSPMGKNPHANALFWNLGHILEVIGNRLGDWVRIGDFADWSIPIEMFPTTRGTGQRFEACLFVAYDLVRPMGWLGLIDDGRTTQSLATPLEDRLIRKTQLFDKFIRRVTPTSDGSPSLH